MKTILLCKRIDLFVQCAALLWGVTIGSSPEDGYFAAYFAVGGVQVLSVLAHIPLRRGPWVSRGRSVHAWCAAALGVLAALGFGIEALALEGQNNVLLIAAYTSLLAAPMLAVMYGAVCWRETVRVQRFANRRLFL